MGCQRCQSERVVSVNAKCSDLCFIKTKHQQPDSYYVPRGLNIGGGDYIRFNVCLNCGQMQGKYPLPEHELEVEAETDEEDA